MNLFSSQLAKLITNAKDAAVAVRDHLAKPGYVLKYLQPDPHTLSAEDKKTRLELADQMQ
jgi:hypothetical protein